MVEYLNDQNIDVKAAHESDVGKEILAGRAVLPMQASSILHNEDKEGHETKLHDYVQNRPKRQTRQPSRLIDELQRAMVEDEDLESEEEPEEAASPYGDDLDRDDGRALTAAEMKKMFRQQSMALQEAFSQEEYNLRLLLSLPKDKVYTPTDLTDPAILERALRILFSRRIGMNSPIARLGPHITYSMVPSELRLKMAKLIESTPSVSMLKLKWRTLRTMTTPAELKRQAIQDGVEQNAKRARTDEGPSVS